jgi:putative DNA primase/helicase
MNLCGNEEKSYNYFNKWLAWQLINPTSKLPTAIIFQGRQGSGKGTFTELILGQIFGDNAQEINQTHLESSFNEYLLGKQIIVANEVMHSDNRQTLPNVLKNLVTDAKITISRKFRKEIVGQNYTHWIFCTNSDNPIKIEEDDRRYSVFYSEKLRQGLGKELRENIDHEIKEYINYLKELNPTFEEVSEPLMTEAKSEIIDLNKDSVQKFREYLQQFSNFKEAYISIYGNPTGFFVDESFGDGESYVLTEKVYLLYEKWCEVSKERAVFAKQNFGKKFSNTGCRSLSKRKKDNVFRMYQVSDIENLMVIEQ